MKTLNRLLKKPFMLRLRPQGYAQHERQCWKINNFRSP